MEENCKTLGYIELDGSFLPASQVMGSTVGTPGGTTVVFVRGGRGEVTVQTPPDGSRPWVQWAKANGDI